MSSSRLITENSSVLKSTVLNGIEYSISTYNFKSTDIEILNIYKNILIEETNKKYILDSKYSCENGIVTKSLEISGVNSEECFNELWEKQYKYNSSLDKSMIQSKITDYFEPVRNKSIIQSKIPDYFQPVEKKSIIQSKIPNYFHPVEKK